MYSWLHGARKYLQERSPPKKKGEPVETHVEAGQNNGRLSRYTNLYVIYIYIYGHFGSCILS